MLVLQYLAARIFIIPVLIRCIMLIAIIIGIRLQHTCMVLLLPTKIQDYLIISAAKWLLSTDYTCINDHVLLGCTT